MIPVMARLVMTLETASLDGVALDVARGGRALRRQGGNAIGDGGNGYAENGETESGCGWAV